MHAGTAEHAGVVWALIQDDWCPYKKRKFVLKHTHTQNGILVTLLQAKELEEARSK